NDLMQYMERKYYVSLLSAAVFHGGSHQQPQDFYVTIAKPQIKTIKTKDMKKILILILSIILLSPAAINA
ncbi:MAG: hypothetical protein KAV70_05475, partial [Bacteroidales bacterium]|nr:hypothetical protein [Bacteroidales bacterium]